jgi:predicted nucleic acid-binding Zn ribbon protein
LWLQFYDAVLRDGRFRACRQCGTWFDRAGVGKGKQQFCSNNCRLRAHRERVKEAGEMYNSGATIEKIAAEFDADPETVQNWLRTEKLL